MSWRPPVCRWWGTLWSARKASLGAGAGVLARFLVLEIPLPAGRERVTLRPRQAYVATLAGSRKAAADAQPTRGLMEMQTAEPRGAGPAASQDIGYRGAELGQSGEDKVASWALQNTCVNIREARSDSGRRGLCVTWGHQGDTLRTWNHLSAVEDQVSGWCLLCSHSSLPGDGVVIGWLCSR